LSFDHEDEAPLYRNTLRLERTSLPANELESHAEGLICLTGGSDGPLSLIDTDATRQATEWLIQVFGKKNVYAELQRHFNREEEARNQAVMSLAEQFGLSLLATNGVNHATPIQREVSDVFTCIRNHVRLENGWTSSGPKF
jgi:error-prone DNA polymerase